MSKTLHLDKYRQNSYIHLINETHTIIAGSNEDSYDAKTEKECGPNNSEFFVLLWIVLFLTGRAERASEEF